MPESSDFETLAPPPGSPGGGSSFSRTSDKARSGGAKKQSGLSLKARAINILSRREHSRFELQKKLAAHASDPDQLEQLLNELECQKWLSTERFAQSLVHRRAAGRGTQRIVQELREHGVGEDCIAALSGELNESEGQRARQVWQRKFPDPPTTQKEYARQYRFLAARGFSQDVIRRLLGPIPAATRS